MSKNDLARRIQIYQFIYKLLLVLIVIRLTIIGMNLVQNEFSQNSISLSGFLFVDLIDETFASWDILFVLIPFFSMFLYKRKKL